MLVLSRKLNQEIVIGDNVTLRILKIKGNTIRLGIDAPRDVKIVRGELPSEIETELPTDSKDDADAPNANVTVVFSNDAGKQGTKRDVIPFRRNSSDQPACSSTEAVRNANPPAESRYPSARDVTSANSVQFRQKLPKQLHHNRLKQLVKELTDKGCNATDN